MFYTTAKEFWNSYIRMINKGFLDVNMQNPAVEFVRKAKRGELDHLDDEEYSKQLADTEDISAFWNEEAIDSASKILLRALNQTSLSEEQIDQLSEILSNASTTTNYHYMEQHKCNNLKNIYKDIWNTDTNPSRNMPDITFETNEQYNMPYDIYNYLNHHIYGQESAKKAAAMLIYNHIRGNRRHIVMAGATGCGKTEIWRTLSQKYDFIQIINGPQISADGWYGSYHIKDIFWNIPQDLAQKLVIVIDEADKMLEPQIGGNGTDHSILIQNELLKIMDGDTITFTGDRNNSKSITIDCSNISIVFCGSFERMLREKTEASGGIGFGQSEKTESKIKECSEEDLIKYGNVRREIAGRINQIICLNTLDAKNFEKILKSEISPIKKIEKAQHVLLSVNENSYKKLAIDAANSGLGCRYIRSKLQSLLDEKIFENPNEYEYDLYYK